MQHTKTYYIKRNFCYGILVFIIAVCPFFSEADQHANGSPEDTSNEQIQDPAPLTSSDLNNALSKQRERFDEMFNEHQDPSLIFTAILGFLLLIILSFLVWMSFRYRSLTYELDSIKHKIEVSTKVNNSLKQELLDVRDRIQRLVKTSDSEILYEKLAAENRNNTQEVIDLLIPIGDIIENKVALRHQETAELSQQQENRTSEQVLPESIVEFCNRYNAGIENKREQANFLEHYVENYKITVVNVEDRYTKPQREINPIFKTEPAGRFWAFYIEDVELYAIVPVYDLTVGHLIYRPGAFGEVFKCSNFDPQRNYQILKIIQPAVFETDSAKETWVLKAKGKLELRET